MDDKVMVSVICNVYNHEKYIRDCLDGFIMQITNYKFEVIVHDDASTDNSTKIITEYELKYPNIIKPIYETENKYSKGISIREIEKPYVKGKYIAICEGDDCWTHPFKLQKQVDFLENNPDYSMCVHNAIKHYSDGKEEYVSKSNITRDYSTNEIIEMMGGAFSTNSIMLKKEIFFSVPKCFYCPQVGDFQLYIYGSICGKVRYMIDVMSRYNVFTDNSWSKKTFSDPAKTSKYYEDMITMLKKVDEYYNREYTTSINKNIALFEYYLLDIKKENKKIFSSKYISTLHNLIPSRIDRIKLCISLYFPRLTSIYRSIKAKTHS